MANVLLASSCQHTSWNIPVQPYSLQHVSLHCSLEFYKRAFQKQNWPAYCPQSVTSESIYWSASPFGLWPVVKIKINQQFYLSLPLVLILK